jgi:hypothetical protein
LLVSRVEGTGTREAGVHSESRRVSITWISFV